MTAEKFKVGAEMQVPGASGGPELFARRISGVAIFPCEGGRDEAGEQALAVWPSTRAAPSA